MSIKRTRALMYRYWSADHGDVSMLADDVHAVFEGTFVRRHVGEFAGIAATGNTVHVPICIIYDVEGEQIKYKRIDLELPVLMQQFTATMLPA